MSNPLIKEALDYEAYFNSNEKLRQEYVAREEAILDEKLRAGHNRAEGKKEEKRNNAINLLKLGVNPQIVSQGIGMPLDEVLELQAKEK